MPTLRNVKIPHVNRFGDLIIEPMRHFVDFIGFLQRRSKDALCFSTKLYKTDGIHLERPMTLKSRLSKVPDTLTY